MSGLFLAARPMRSLKGIFFETLFMLKAQPSTYDMFLFAFKDSALPSTYVVSLEQAGSQCRRVLPFR
jgi:hypothetical protein